MSWTSQSYKAEIHSAMQILNFTQQRGYVLECLGVLGLRLGQGLWINHHTATGCCRRGLILPYTRMHAKKEVYT